MWVDLETTGDDIGRDVPVELAAIITTPRLEELDRISLLIDPEAAGWERIQSQAVIVEMHTASGLLTDLLRAGRPLLRTRSEADAAVVAWAQRAGCEPNRTVLAGSGVIAFDKPIIARCLPLLDGFLQDRPGPDMGVLRRAWRLIAGDEPTRPEPTNRHRALDDIAATLEEARVYQARMRTAA